LLPSFFIAIKINIKKILYLLLWYYKINTIFDYIKQQNKTTS